MPIVRSVCSHFSNDSHLTDVLSMLMTNDVDWMWGSDDDNIKI